MAISQSSTGKNKALYINKYDSMVEYKNDPLDDVGHDESTRESTSANDEGVYQDRDYIDGVVGNEHSLLLPGGDSSESDKEDDYEQERAEAQRNLDYRHQHRFIILGLVALTPSGVKFFKAAQSSFEEYLMNDPRILMSATTYSLSLSLMSLPVATLIGGAMLDYKAKKEKQKKINQQQQQQRYSKSSIIPNCLRNPISTQQSCLGTSRTPSYSAIFFLGISLLGIIIYGYGLETLSSIPVGLAGATIFGLGEGCVVVASRTFVAHAFYGSDGAFAQGVLVAMNNIAMMASKISLPWLIENNKKIHSITNNCIHNVSLDCVEDENFAFDHNTTTIPSHEYYTTERTEHDDNNIWIGVVACCMVQLLSLSAGIIYAWWFGLAPLPQSLQKESSSSSPKQDDTSCSTTTKRAFLSSENSMKSRVTACFEKLPTTFWIVAIGRAIFVVVFKIFTRNSNSFLMVSKNIYSKNTFCGHKQIIIQTNLDRSLIQARIALTVTIIYFPLMFVGKIWCEPCCCR